MYIHGFKRLIDIILSLLGILILAIPMLIVSIAIVLDDPGPVIFKQKRVGIKREAPSLSEYCFRFASRSHSLAASAAPELGAFEFVIGDIGDNHFASRFAAVRTPSSTLPV